MSKYRFKTKEEFVRDELWDDKYNCPDSWNFNKRMNKYLGIDIPEEFSIYCDKNSGFEYDDWIFSKNDYVLKEQQEYFDDLSQHIGRYIKALVDYPHSGGVKKGDVGRIINKHGVNFPSQKRYSCSNALSKGVLGVKYELLPEDYSPEQETKGSNVEFIPGKWYKVELSNKFNHYIKVDSVTEDEITLDCEGYVANLNKWDKGTSINLKTVTKYDLLTDLSVIQKYLPDGHPDKITSDVFKKGEYVVLISDGQSTAGARLVQSDQFIKNHCYKVRENKVFLRPELDSNGSTTNGWKSVPYNPNEYHKNRNWRYATEKEAIEYEKRGKPYDVTELQKKELSMEEIQEECKKRFPIGCTFIAVGSCMHRILKEDSCTYSIVGKQIWAHDCAGWLYGDGKWAELVSLPKQNDLKEEAIKYSEETNATILLASNIKSKELHSTYGNTSLSTKLLSNKITSLINNVGVVSSVNLKIK